MNQDEYDKLMQSFRKSMANHPHAFSFGLSPTDVDSKGMYEYQEPEVDEQGTYYGYKILYRHSCPNPECTLLVSPRYQSPWENGELQANHEPTEDSMFGIHCTKRPDHPELQKYIRRYSEPDWVLVKCALSGTIAHTEQGFRAEHAQIIGVYIDEHWQNYQDYERRSQAYSHRDSWEARYDFGSSYRNYKDPWNPNP